MGNCLILSNKVLVHNEHEPRSAVEEITRSKAFTRSTLEAGKHFDGDKSKKMLKFRVRGEDLQREGERESDVDVDEPKGGVFRVKVMVTQEELKQILNYKKDLNNSSVEQFVTAMKLRGRRIHAVRTNDEGINSNWRPALESIPEDQ